MTGEDSKTHRSRAIRSVRCAVITVSDSRTAANDTSGALMRELLTAAGHEVVDSAILRDDPETVRRRVRAWCDDPTCQVVLLTGGTGITARDSTVEAIAELFEKRLDGFGELFRMLSYEQIGAAAMLSRATAGACDRTLIFAMPGSTAAVRLAMEQLIVPDLGHLTAMVEAC